MKFFSVAFFLLCSSTAAATELPPNHLTTEVLAKFRHHFRCPYATEWVTKGPHQAAMDLGIVPKRNDNITSTTSTTFASSMMRGSHRSLQDDDMMPAAGSCVFINSWTGQPTCVEFRGSSYTLEDMQTRCVAEPDSTLNEGEACSAVTESSIAGWCLVSISDSMVEATPMVGDCQQNQMACQSFMSGTFDGNCDGGGGDGEEQNPASSEPEAEGADGGYGNTTVPDEAVTCRIAPGAIGAGHQAAYSMGYSNTCPGTPAEGSPYMWPMAWRAHVESKSMAFGSDDVLYHSKGIVSYRLDKNWKRQDWYYQRGVQRAVGQAPCPPEDIDQDFSEGPLLACRRNSDDYSTMIHRGSKMMFISWKTGTEIGSSDPNDIADCNFLDLQVIGNIRPDWFMDDRGDSTDVQYLGDQHVFYEGEPRLVKQWRKKDFANQYFVMSMLGNPKEDELHWPMTLNVPGEGFGDDFLQIYTNQTLLTDEDDYLFKLDTEFEAIGGSCPEIGGFGDGDNAGPPTNSDVHIPSNLEVDPNSWFSNVYTFSPVWESPDDIATADMGNSTSTSATSGNTGVATTKADRVTVRSCYDESANSVKLSVEFQDVVMGDDDSSSVLPWMALGFRETEECLMNPRSGDDTSIVLIMDNGGGEGGGAQAYSGSLPAMARGGSESAVASIYPSLVPLEEAELYSNVILQEPGATAVSRSDSVVGDDATSVRLEFTKSLEDNGSPPETMYLMYAIGSSPVLGFHATRSCFEVTEFPNCPEVAGVGDMTAAASADEDSLQGASAAGAPRGAMFFLTTSAAVIIAAGLFLL